MTAVLDRAFQRAMLERLASTYPDSTIVRPEPEQTLEGMTANLHYLFEHGLVRVNWLSAMDGKVAGPATITAKGMDFLADDGGLSAILGVFTVKLHDDTIRKLLIDRIEKAEGERSIKDQLIAKVKELPAEALGAITTAGLDAALAQAPQVLTLLRNILRV